jgi:hypothetical protein
MDIQRCWQFGRVSANISKFKLCNQKYSASESHVCIVCLNSKFPLRVELSVQNKNISKLGIVITKVGNIITYFINMIRKH